MNIDELIAACENIENKNLSIMINVAGRATFYAEYFIDVRGIPVLTMDDEEPLPSVKTLTDLYDELNNWRRGAISSNDSATLCVEILHEDVGVRRGKQYHEIDTYSIEGGDFFLHVSLDNQVMI